MLCVDNSSGHGQADEWTIVLPVGEKWEEVRCLVFFSTCPLAAPSPRKRVSPFFFKKKKNETSSSDHLFFKKKKKQNKSICWSVCFGFGRQLVTRPIVHPLCGARILQRTFSPVVATMGSSSTLLMEVARAPLCGPRFCIGHFTSNDHGNIGFFEHFLEEYDGDGGPPLLQQCERLVLQDSAISKVVLRAFVLVPLRSQVKVVRSFIGLREVLESDSSLHVSSVMNSSKFICGC